MKKTGAIILAVVMLCSIVSAVPVVSAENVVELLNMDFESYDTGNVLYQFSEAEVTKTGITRRVPTSGIGATINFNKAMDSLEAFTSSADITVINTGIPGGRSGKVLKYRNATTNGGNYSERNHVVGFIAPTNTNTQDLYVKGCVMVVEYDVYIESSAKGNIDLITSAYNMNGESYGYGDTKLYAEGSSNSKIFLDASKNGSGTANVVTDGWTKVKIVSDLTGTQHSFRVYINDVPVKTSTNTYDLKPGTSITGASAYKDSFSGLVFGGYGIIGAGAVYYDNITVKKIDTDFKFSETYSFDDVNPNTDVLKMKFTTSPDTDTLKEIYLASKDLSVKYTDAVKVEKDSTDTNAINVMITGGTTLPAGEYKLVFPATFTDIYGQGLGTVGTETVNVSITTNIAYEIVKAQVIPAIVEDYDLGKQQEVVAVFPEEVEFEGELADAFEVKDEEGKTIEGLAAVVSGNEIQFSLDKLKLGNGTHTVTLKENAIKTKSGKNTHMSFTINTLDFNLSANETEIVDYVIGDERQINITSTVAMDNITADSFDVKNPFGEKIEGLKVDIVNDKEVILDISEIIFLKGTSTITANGNLKDLRGRNTEYIISVTVKDFEAKYENMVDKYTIGADKVLEVVFTQPVSDESAANIQNVFKVENAYSMSVTGLTAEISDDKKIVSLQLSGLDINGGEYEIFAPYGSITAVNGEVNEKISIKLSTETINVTEEDKGVITDKPTEESFVILADNFENYESNVEWIENVPEKWEVIKTDSEEFADDTIRVVKDPENPDNKVLKISAGHYDNNSKVVSTGYNYNTLIRKPDNVPTEAELTDDKTIISVKSKIYVDEDAYNGFPIYGSSPEEQNGMRVGSIVNALSDTSATAIPPHLTRVNSARNNKEVLINLMIDPVDEQGNPSPRDTDHRLVITAGEWHELEYVITTINGNKYFKIVLDGKSFSGDATENYKYFKASNNMQTFYGMMARLVSNAAEGVMSPIIYYDDWKVECYKQLEAYIEVEKSNFKPDRKINIIFTNEISAKSFEEIVKVLEIADSNGNKVMFDAVQTEGNLIEITPLSVLRYDTDYTIKINNLKKSITDIYGNVLRDILYNFRTAKALDVCIDVKNGNMSHNGETVSDATQINYVMKLNQPATENLCAVVALYSNNNTLLAFKMKKITVGNDSENFALDVPNKGTVSIKMFLYSENSENVFGYMLQRPDEISAK